MPLATLATFGVGLVMKRVARPEERPLDVTPPPEAQLPGIVLPPRARELAGKVVDPDGNGIEGALVSLIAADEPHWTYTDAEGAFVIRGVERGPWTVTVSATAHLPFATTVADDAGTIVFALPDGKRTYPVLARRELGALSGFVRAASGVPLAGIEVLFTPTAPLEEIDAPYPRRVQCDSGGRFEIPDLQVGEYTVSVLPEWAENGTWPDLSRAEGAPPRVWKHTRDAKGTLDLDSVAGAVHGLVVDDERNPLAGALVLVSSEASSENVWPPVTADAQGAFVVGDLPPGRYVVSVRAGSGSHQMTAVVLPRETTELALPPLLVERPR